MAKEYDKPVAMDWVENPNTGKHHTVFETGAPSIENGKVILPGYTSLTPIEEVDQQQESNHPEVPKNRAHEKSRRPGIGGY
jgi:hypothetical protein